MVFSILYRTVCENGAFFVADNKNGAPLSPSSLLTLNLTMNMLFPILRTMNDMTALEFDFIG